MKCPICSAEIQSGVLVCPECRAIQTVERTTLGVFAGWMGILSSVLTAMMIIPMPIMLFAGVSLQGFPWWLPIVGLSMASSSLWYSNKTKHIVWLDREKIR